MTLVKVAPSSANGKAVSTISTPPKSEHSQPVILTKEPEKVPPLEERLHRLNELFHLQTSYNKLQESLQKLNEFEIKKDGERSRITLQDDSRNDFTTFNPEIIKEVTAFLKSRIKERIKTLEPQLKW